MPIKPATAEDEYKKYKDLRKEDVVALQQWMEKQPHLPQISELQVIQFFQSCYFKTEATKLTIDNYFALKTYWPEYFTDRNPNTAALKLAMGTSLVTILPNRTPEGYIVVFACLVDYDPSNFNFIPYIKLFDMIGMTWLGENGTAEGLLLVIDMNHVALGHLATMSISGMKNLFCYLQEALPARLKGMHYLNTGVVMDKLMLLMKPFIKKELLEVLHTHVKVDKGFFEFVPQHLLPSDYGGAAPSVTELHAAMKNILFDNVNYILELENTKGDESKRIEKRNDPTHGYGLDGSFKKLDVD